MLGPAKTSRSFAAVPAALLNRKLFFRAFLNRELLLSSTVIYITESFGIIAYSLVFFF
jgi:hypothetical protein